MVPYTTVGSWFLFQTVPKIFSSCTFYYSIVKFLHSSVFSYTLATNDVIDADLAHVNFCQKKK